MNAARKQQFETEESKLEFAILELAAALQGVRETPDAPLSLSRAIRAHRAVGKANARLLDLLCAALDELEEDTTPEPS